MKTIVAAILLLVAFQSGFAATKFASADLKVGNKVAINGTIECYYEACPPGWEKQSWSKCYKLRPIKAARDEAERDCRSMDSSLGIVHSDSERTFLNSLVTRDLPNNDGIWLGAVRRGSYWFTSDLTNFQYNAWVPGHPDFEVGQCAMLLSDMAFLGQTYWGRLLMEDCSRPLYYACQKSQYDFDKLVCKPRE